MTPALKQELSQKAYSGEFEAMPNKTHVWSKTILLGGDEFVVYAVQTEG